MKCTLNKRGSKTDVNRTSMTKDSHMYYSSDHFVLYILTQECRIISSELLYCFAPGFDTPLLRVRRSNNEYVATKLSFGFIMDNVSSVVNMTSREGWQFSLYPNPIIHPFEEGSKSFQIKEGEEEQYLTIKVIIFWHHRQ